MIENVASIRRAWTHAVVSSRLGAQFKALNFTCRGLRQFCAEFDPAGIFESRELLAAMLTQRKRHYFARLAGRLKHHKCLGPNQAILIGPSRHRRFEHVRMAHQHAFNLERRHVNTADLHHVVPPPAIQIVAVLVLDVFVAGTSPLAQKSRAGLLAVVPIHDCGSRPPDLQLTHLTLRDNSASLVNEADVVAWYGFGAGALEPFASAVGHECVEHFRRPKSVKYMNAEAFPPGPPDIGRKRFAGGN